MTYNPYAHVCLHVQAVRRYFEGIRTPLAPALGVAASLYTHQVANVHRVLTDVRVRHLLADEVGLGKTVQALMVLNALRSQQGDIRALIVVPDRLVPQWRDELMNRAHTAPFGESGGVEGSQYIRLAWEAQLRMSDAEGGTRLSLSDIDPGQFDVLIVDELHRLRIDLQDRIVRIAADFEHLIVLTATPAFQSLERRAQLFALLEPERTASSRWRIAGSERGRAGELSASDDLSQWPHWAISALVEDFIRRDEEAAASTPEEELRRAAMTHCAYRRVIRTRRVDYEGVLPRRSHHPLVVEPIGAEEDRQSLMWQYFDHLPELTRSVDPVLLAKRVILSPPSLEQRVDFLLREGHDRQGILAQVKPLVHRSNGDSRADALMDLLAAVWHKDPSERVLVAAQDNLTVDYLFDLVQARLPLIGPFHNRVRMVPARIRQGMMVEAVEDIAGFGNETNENLEAFQRGEAQVLFAPDAGQVGLNLQCARVLVLYSVPWQPEEVEQWIGRLDRIGNVAAMGHGGEFKTIDVYTIAQRGLVDEKVVTVLKRFNVFERSVNLDGDHLDEVTQKIQAAALHPDNVDWDALEDATEGMAADDEVKELESSLRPYLPWTLASARDERRKLDELKPAPPVLTELPDHSAKGPPSWDRAVEGLVELLKRADEYHIRWNVDLETGRRFKTLWYKFGARGVYGDREVLSKVLFSFGADPGHERSPRYSHAFITRRGDIGIPPRRSVSFSLDEEEVRRPLRFLNFGDALHDELVDGWLPQDQVPRVLEVSLPPDHQFWDRNMPSHYLLRLAVLDPATALLDAEVRERAARAISTAAVRTTDPERLTDLVQPYAKRALRSALQSDVRWLRGVLSADLRIDLRRWDRFRWNVTEAEEGLVLLNPLAQRTWGVPTAVEWDPPEDVMPLVQEELARLRTGDAQAADSSWSHKLPELGAESIARLEVVCGERQDATALLNEELKQAEDSLGTTKERGNRGQITRAENALNAAADRAAMGEALWRQREVWLEELPARVRWAQPKEWVVALINVRRG